VRIPESPAFSAFAKTFCGFAKAGRLIIDYECPDLSEKTSGVGMPIAPFLIQVKGLH
jgi:hypothetical protein